MDDVAILAARSFENTAIVDAHTYAHTTVADDILELSQADIECASCAATEHVVLLRGDGKWYCNNAGGRRASCIIHAVLTCW